MCEGDKDVADREGIVEEVGEFLERLGRRLSHLERDNSRWESRSERMAERAERMAGRMAERFGFGFRIDHDGSDEEEEQDGHTVERELTFGEQPELRLTAGPMRVHLLQVEPGGVTRAVLKGRDAADAELEIGTWDGATAVEVRPGRGLHAFRHFSRLALYLYLPEGIRVRGRVDAGSMTAEGLQASELDLRTDAGKLRLVNCQGRMRITSSAGKVTVENCMGDLEAHADAGKIAVTDFSGTVRLRAEAGAVVCRGLRLAAGEHTLETKLGTIDATLVPDVPVRIETKASLGSVANRIGDGPADAAATLIARTELGSIRLRHEESPPTPLRSVVFTDERGADDRDSGSYQPVDLEPVSLESDEGTESPHQPAANGDQAPAGAMGSEAGAATPVQQSETLRILGMVERHEISADDAASLLAAIRRQ
jgi:hypothetical protein